MAPPEPTCRILLVDDRAENLMFVRDYLVSRGYEVATALSGPIALEQMADSPPHVVLLDLEMPEMSGIEVLQYMQRSESLSQIPVVVLSAHPRDEIAADCEAAGARGVLSKPIRLRVLLELLVSLGF